VETDIWRYRDESWTSMDISGFGVEAIDGSIGKIDRIDMNDEKVYVNPTRDEIESAPEFHDPALEDERYRGDLAGYHGPGGTGYRDWGAL
jgi:hypothetical protein